MTGGCPVRSGIDPCVDLTGDPNDTKPCAHTYINHR